MTLLHATRIKGHRTQTAVVAKLHRAEARAAS